MPQKRGFATLLCYGRRMNPRRLFGRTMRLRDAASVVFALVAVLPILLFVYFLSRANLLGQLDVQLGLLLALAVSILGFLVFRRITRQITRIARGLQAAAQEASTGKSRAGRPGSLLGLGQVAEMGQVADTFHQMLEDLRGSTQRLEDLVFKLGALNEMVELGARIPQIQDLLGLVLQTTMRTVRATTGSIMILDRDHQVLRLAASRGVPDTVLATVELKIGEGIAGQVAQLGEPVLVEDMEADPRFARADASRHGGGAFICMPIRAGDRVIGVINMVKRTEGTGALRPQPFGALDFQFLNALMTYIGYAVENARLLEAAQRAAQQLQKVVDDLKATQEQLVRGETLRAMGQLSSGITHHLNNLFAVILGRTELLLGQVQDAGVQRSLEVIRRTAEDGAEVARRVQRFSRLQPVTEMTSVDLNQIARDVIEATRSRWHDEAAERGAPIEVALEAGAIAPVAGEPVSLREAMLNLILNAIEAMPDGGKITVRSWQTDGHVHCMITDTGVGMPREVRRRALEPFFTTKGPKTTGLGLSVAYGAATRYGGALAIDSADGRGTTVTMTLPVAGAAMLPGDPPTTGSEPAVAPLRILVIDDEASVRETLAAMLELQGHTVVQATTGTDGLQFLEDGVPIDLALTDLTMPDMSGWEVAASIRERWPRLPVGLITGWFPDQLSDEERGRVDFVLAKPFDRLSVRELVAEVQSR